MIVLGIVALAAYPESQESELELFSDPEGSYTMTIDPDWIANHGAFGELFYVGDVTDGFAANINITTRVVEGSPSLQEYVQLNIDPAAFLLDEFNFLGSEIVEGTSGQELALVEYEAENSGVFVHVLSIFAVDRGEAVLAALTTAPDAFDEIRASVEPYLLTLRVTA